MIPDHWRLDPPEEPPEREHRHDRNDREFHQRHNEGGPPTCNGRRFASLGEMADWMVAEIERICEEAH